MSRARRLRASAVCVAQREGTACVLCVRLRDPHTRVARLFPPGGAIEAGESPAHAAEREALEETGYAVRVDATSERVARYPFEWNGVPRDVTTHFFRAQLDEAASVREVRDASYHEGVVWLPLRDVARELAFETAIRDAVLALIED